MTARADSRSRAIGRVPSADRTSPMTVSNMGFLLDRLGADCAPLQFIRELTVNSIQAIEALNGRKPGGQIVWDYDPAYRDELQVYKLRVIDTGIGMTGPQMVDLINRLSSSGRVQSIEGNYGVGAKIAAATRNHAGVVYFSWVAGTPLGAMIHLWRNPEGQYGLKQLEWPDGTFEYWAPVGSEAKPDIIKDHGTVVVLLGNDEEKDDTMTAPDNAPVKSKWIARYLNSRFYTFPDGITVRAREGWLSESSDTNVQRRVQGARYFLDTYKEAAGTVELSGAHAHWWILKDIAAVNQNTGISLGGMHAAALYQNEMYDVVTQRSAIARLQSFGISLGYQHVVLHVEPKDAALTTNTARTTLLLNNEPLPWSDWAEEFKSNLPVEIRAHIDRISGEQEKRAYEKTIKERLKELQELYRLKKYRPASDGIINISDDLITGAASTGTGKGRGGGGGGGGVAGTRSGSLYTRFLADVAGQSGAPARDRFDDVDVRWVSEAELGIQDRAALYDASNNLLLINQDFRVFTGMIDYWIEKLKDRAGATPVIEAVVQEWFEQTLREVVYSVESFRGARHWNREQLSSLVSPEALTAAVLPRYNLNNSVSRALGSKLGALTARATT